MENGLFLNNMRTFPYQIILGSGSPRRKQLLEGLDLPFTVDVITSLDEHNYPAQTPPHEIPQWLSMAKSHSYPRPLQPNQLLITADTLVFCKGKILGKPLDKEDAHNMLSRLSGTTHQVITGVSLRSGDGLLESFSDTTTVTFSVLKPEEIDYYLETYAPYDKAGAYGAQEWIGYIGISKLEGSYFNVMGLPVHRLWERLCAAQSHHRIL